MMKGEMAIGRRAALTGSDNHRLPRALWIAVLLGLTALLLFLPAAEASADEGRIVVELEGHSSGISQAGRTISGTDNVTRQEYKFKQERYGTDFHYTVSGLSRTSYAVEFSFFEPVYLPGQRVFSVYANASPTPLSGLSNLDIASKVGLNAAYQVTVPNVQAPGGKLSLHFKASKKEATICNIRLIAAGRTATEINVMDTRHWKALPLRFVNGAGQDLHEVILGRFGSRFMINPVPQLLAWRQSPLGTWTDDLSELVLAFRDDQGDIRCLPFTDRYPVFSSMDQEMTLTGVSYVCRDAALPFTATVTLRAPFYPEDEKLSSAPFFYVDVEVTNPGGAAVSGDFMLARPHRDNTGSAVPADLEGGLPGYKFESGYTYNDESRIGETSGGVYKFWEALCVDEDLDVTMHSDLSDASWIWPSPSGYPLPYANQAYTFIPRGYSGLEWSFDLGPGGSASRSVVLAAHTTQKVLTVRRSGSNLAHYFLYRNPAGPNLGTVEAVIEYAFNDRTSILEKTAFFDTILSGTYVSPLGKDAKDLAAVALQNFIINAWWVYDGSGADWFSVWEGIPCMFHSTIDVEYNDAWFYLYFWPDLLEKLLQEWPAFENSNAQGKYLSHDMGVVNNVTGMAYPHDMPVEENANYVLLLYSHWKTTGDTAFMRNMFGRVREYTRFIFACDTDGDGLPDLNTANTIDQGSDAVQHARNQTYLGVKAMAAYRAAAEMARAQTSPDNSFISSCDRRVRLINITLENKLWLGNHFAVCDDPDVSQAERNAYSIYASNGLLYLLAAGLDPGLTEANLGRFRQDLANAAAKTSRRYGYVHTSVDNENQWVSQNLWRDALGYWLGVPGWAGEQAERLTRYWNLQHYFATKKDGGFWDVCDYRDYLFLGTSEAFGLGFGDPSLAAQYLAEARVEAGGARGAYALDSAYWQSLGYYPRGTAFFSYLSAMARLRLDRASGYLIYDAAHAPGRVPVFACADWDNKNIPVLVFDADGGLQQVINGGLLPANVNRSSYQLVTGLSAHPFSCSPGTGSPRQEVGISFNAPAGSVKGAYVLDNAGNTVRELTAGAAGTTWDGRDGSGQPVPDGTYTVYIETLAPNPSVHIPDATVQVGVNTNLPSPAATWYLAEGFTGSNATGGDFETWVLIQNPGDEAAAVNVTFMQPGGVNTERAYSLSPRSRFTVHVDAVLPDAEVSTRIEASVPVVAERAMYFNGRLAGHDTIGVNHASQRWYLAEGYTGGDFDEWVLIQNPNETEAAVNVQLQPQDQGVVDLSYSVPPRSRFTIHVDDILPDAQVSTYVESSLPVVVERAQYLNSMRSGTCSIAARSPSYTWFFAEGYTSEGFEEWLLVQNPQDTPTLVDITFMQLDGTNTSMQFTVAPRSRYTVPVHMALPGAQVSARVSSQLPVVAERAMYWKERSDGHATLGSPTPDYTWFFPEGYTSEGFEEWLLVQNPWDGKATVRFDFMLPGGSNQSMTFEVAGRSRFTVNVAAVVGETEVSIKLTSDLPVVGERAIYFEERSGGHCSIGAIE